MSSVVIEWGTGLKSQGDMTWKIMGGGKQHLFSIEIFKK